MKSERATEVITGTIRIQGTKALKIDFGGTDIIWVPESIIHTPYNRYDTELEQEFEIEKWFLNKHKLGWG